jgi:hypothetical protein
MHALWGGRRLSTMPWRLTSEPCQSEFELSIYYHSDMVIHNLNSWLLLQRKHTLARDIRNWARSCGGRRLTSFDVVISQRLEAAAITSWLYADRMRSRSRGAMLNRLSSRKLRHPDRRSPPSAQLAQHVSRDSPKKQLLAYFGYRTVFTDRQTHSERESGEVNNEC